MVRSLALLAIATLFLAGCTGSGTTNLGLTASTSASAGPATVTADTGGLEARVLNDEALPIEGAEVGITPTDKLGKTDADGLLSFSDLAPGKYKVIAQRIGYASTAVAVEVLPGQVSYVNLTLAPIEIIEPFVEPLILNGYIHAGNALLDIFTALLVPDVCENCVHQFKVNDTAKTLVFEVSFLQTIPDPRGTKLYTQTYRGGTPSLDDSKVLFNANWANRHKAVKEVDWEGDEAIYQLLVCGQESVCVDQRYTEYVSIFHHASAPTDFSALPPL